MVPKLNSKRIRFDIIDIYIINLRLTTMTLCHVEEETVHKVYLMHILFYSDYP